LAAFLDGQDLRREPWPISTRGNKSENDDSSIIEPIELVSA